MHWSLLQILQWFYDLNIYIAYKFTYSVAGIFLFLFYFIFFEVKRLLNLNILFTEFY